MPASPMHRSAPHALNNNRQQTSNTDLGIDALRVNLPGDALLQQLDCRLRLVKGVTAAACGGNNMVAVIQAAVQLLVCGGPAAAA